jgi:hypothetical protein
MSYGNIQATPAGGKGGGKGGWMIVLIIIGIAMFLMFSGERGGQPGDGQQADPASGQSMPEKPLGTHDTDAEPSRREIVGGGGDFESKPMPSKNAAASESAGGGSGDRSNDWAIDDVSKPNYPSAPASQSSQSGDNDSSIDDVTPDQKKNQFQFSNPANSKPLKTTAADND